MGNEAGFGPNFEAVYKWIKAEDPSRAVQYEQAGENEFTDVFCPMYADYKRMEDYARRTDTTKPLIQCEYAHAMGNSGGGFKEYWDLIRRYPSLQGGFIWDWVDQPLRWTGKGGVEIYAYGGDFNRYDASDNNFCGNGMISPDRVPNPHAYEIGYYYQNIWTTLDGVTDGVARINVFNENFFRDLSAYRMEWELMADGVVMRTGLIEDLDVAPQSSGMVSLNVGATYLGKEWLLNVRYSLKNREGITPAGTVLAKDQLVLVEYKAPEMNIANVATANYAKPEPRVIDSRKDYVVVEGDGFDIEFSRKTGYMVRYAVGCKELIAEGGALTPNFWRAPTDNDMGAGLNNKFAVWRNPEIKLGNLSAKTDGGLAVVTAEYEMPVVGASLQLTYVVNNEGSVQVTQKMVASATTDVPPMFRFGMQLPMPCEYGQIEYYGRGPVENYSDRNHNTLLGIYRQNVGEQFYPYIRPQETGTKTDIRWWKLVNTSRSGLMVESEAPFSASALHYTIESLDDGEAKDQRHSAEVEQADLTNLLIDKVQMGLGCVDSWGAWPLPQYQVPYGNYEFTFMLTPVKHSIAVE